MWPSLIDIGSVRSINRSYNEHDMIRGEQIRITWKLQRRLSDATGNRLNRSGQTRDWPTRVNDTVLIELFVVVDDSTTFSEQSTRHYDLTRSRGPTQQNRIVLGNEHEKTKSCINFDRNSTRLRQSYIIFMIFPMKRWSPAFLLVVNLLSPCYYILLL
jgi:hypothetical protein